MSPLRSGVVFALCTCIAACATPGTGGNLSRTPASRVPAEAPVAVTIGRSTKADVIAVLGKTVMVPFDSGYEVWVYRLEDTVPTRPGTAEFVLLFDPAGILARTRVRPAPLP